MRIRFWLGSSLFALGLLINPAYFAGCGSHGEVLYDFGEEEMVDMLASLNETGTWMFESPDASYTLKLVLSRSPTAQASLEGTETTSPFARAAKACGTTTRIFTETASACATFYISSLPVRGTLTIALSAGYGDEVEIETLPVAGELAAEGTQLTKALLWLDVRSGTRALQLHGTFEHGFDFGGFVGMDLGPDKLDIEEGTIEPIPSGR